jgi:hypothetical protein
MQAAVFNDEIQQGAPWEIHVALTDDSGTGAQVPVNLTGYTGLAQMQKVGSNGKSSITLAFDADRTSGGFTLSLTAAATLLLDPGAKYSYDVRLAKSVDESATFYPIGGSLTVVGTVTRPSA